ncbi:hypothetical protein BD289DRAFT_491001 [Coniella lustricola]|uniref:Fungal-specific transcription factor domain-domain-containing protein n=1 Tax=Coniella lustricola TaxID=2025994 RepID=A0A2T2ZZP5_9PEZI|nr:hypothetical protein BD289DRAFT_491001 [Coniella lustricola]
MEPTPRDAASPSGRRGGGEQEVRIACRHPGCNKTFRRREHLNRHARSHDATPAAHKCFICDRSFVRKDILHRHVLQHNVPPDDNPKRIQRACESCRQRKIRCDADDPCSACQASNVACVRRSPSMWSRGSRGLHASGASSHHTQSGQAGQMQMRAEAGLLFGHGQGGDESDYSSCEEDWNDALMDGNGNENETQTPLRPAVSRSLDSHSSSHDNDQSPAQASSTLASQTLPKPTLSTRTPSPLFFRLAPGTPLAATTSTISPKPPAQTQTQTQIHRSTPRSVASDSGPFSRVPPLRSPSAAGPAGGILGSAEEDFMAWMEHVDQEMLDTMLMPDYSNMPNMAPIHSPEPGNLGQLEALFHELWPLLHTPTLSLDTAAPALVQALAHVKVWIQQQSISRAIAWDAGNISKIFELFMQSLAADAPDASSMPSMEPTISLSSLQTLQALGLVSACAITGNNSSAASQWAVVCVSLCGGYLRQAGVFSATCKIEHIFHIADERWIMVEHFNRLAAHFLRLDAYIALILNQAPTLRWPEMRFNFPASETIWRVATPEERRMLLWHEPAGRYSTSFRTILREGLKQAGLASLSRPKSLFMEDYNLVFCAFLSDIWDVAQEAHHHDHRSYKSPTLDAADAVATWTAYLLDLRGHMEMNYNLEAGLFTPDYAATTANGANNNSNPLFLTTAIINLTIYHLLRLMIVANTSLLETGQCCEYCHNVGIGTRLRLWALGRNARRAVTHAAQLRRLYERETATTGYPICLLPGQQRIANPLRSVGLFTSAVILCSYANLVPCAHVVNTNTNKNLVNDSTSSSSPPPPPQQQAIELAQAEVGGQTCEALEQWICQDTAAGSALLLGVPLCRCSVPALLTWYRDQLGPDSPFTSRLLKFETTLSR